MRTKSTTLKATDLPHYLILLISTAYSTYVSTVFIQNMFPLPIAIGGCLLLSILAHLYLCKSILHLRSKKRISAALPIAIILMAVCITADLKGVVSNTYRKNIHPIENTYQKKIAQKEVELEENRLLISNHSDHSKGKQTNWAKYNTYNKAVRIQQELKGELISLKEEQKQAIQKASLSMQDEILSFKGLSAALFILSILVSFLIDQEGSEANVSIKNTSLNTPPPNGGKPIEKEYTADEVNQIITQLETQWSNEQQQILKQQKAETKITDSISEAVSETVPTATTETENKAFTVLKSFPKQEIQTDKSKELQVETTLNRNIKNGARKKDYEKAYPLVVQDLMQSELSYQQIADRRGVSKAVVCRVKKYLDAKKNYTLTITA